MKVSDFIDKLKEYNQAAEVSVIALNKTYDFSLCYASDGEGGEKDEATTVSIYVDKLNIEDQQNERS